MVNKDKTGVASVVTPPKTGGKADKTTDQTLVDAQVRGKLTELPDAQTVPAELAALYLCISPAQLAEYRQRKTKKHGPTITKHIGADAIAKNQAVLYKLGDLRQWETLGMAPTPWNAAANTGMLDWVSTKLPFFAELKPRSERGRRVLIGNAWDRQEPLREERFVDLVEGRIRFAWLTPAEAATSLWANLASHRAFTDKGLAMLREQTRAIESSLEATKLLEIALPHEVAS